MPVFKQSITIWNRKLHIYLGLYFLLFIWLFAFSGLLLNHPKWTFARFWPDRQETVSTHTLRPLSAVEDMARAGEVMQQFGMIGEVENVTLYPEEQRFKFQAVRPGKIVQVQVKLADRVAEVKEITTNNWGVLHFLHTFNGVRMNDAKASRDWFATQLWVLSMDALCLGVIFLVCSGLYMWYPLIGKRSLGWIVLDVGVFCCGFFVFGLTLLF